MEQLVATQVRASISIPLFFEPVMVRDGETGEQRTLVDGGVLGTRPIEIFDRADAGQTALADLGVKVIPELRTATQNSPPFRAVAPAAAAAPASSRWWRRRSSAMARAPGAGRGCRRRAILQVDPGRGGVVDRDPASSSAIRWIANGERAARGLPEHQVGLEALRGAGLPRREPERRDDDRRPS